MSGEAEQLAEEQSRPGTSATRRSRVATR